MQCLLAHYCSGCDQGLAFWQQAVLGSLAVVIASAALYGLSRIGSAPRYLRGMRLRACFLAVQRAWEREDATQFAPFVTFELGVQLRRQLTAIAASGQVIHHERPRLRKLRVISGGERGENECIARIESTVRHWLTDASSGELVGGSKDVSRDDALWRFVRDPASDWLADEVNVVVPSASWACQDPGVPD